MKYWTLGFKTSFKFPVIYAFRFLNYRAIRSLVLIKRNFRRVWVTRWPGLIQINYPARSVIKRFIVFLGWLERLGWTLLHWSKMYIKYVKNIFLTSVLLQQNLIVLARNHKLKFMERGSNESQREWSSQPWVIKRVY